MRIPLTATLLLVVFISTAQFNGSGFALDFNGTSDYVEIAHTSSQNPGSAFTVEAWINADSWQTNVWEGSIISKDTWSSVSEGWVIRCGSGGKLSFNLALNSNGSWYEIQTGAILVTNKWYHVAGTYDGAVMKLYVNGKQVGSLSQTGSITAATVPIKIGNIARASTSRYFDGEIDEVRIWNAALTEATLRDYMCQKLDNNHPNYNKLISYYNVDLGSGSTVADVSGNGLTGTRYGAAWSVSGAPIGNESTYLYPSSWTNNQVKFGHSAGDSIYISSVSGNPGGIHLYRIDNHPNYQVTPPGVFAFYDTRLWGVYPTSGSNVSFTFDYNYQGYFGITNQSELNLSHRSDNADTSWVGLTAALDTIQQTLIKTQADKGEFIMGSNDILLPFNLLSPSTSSSYTLSGSGSQTIPFLWESTMLGKGTTGTYEWLIDYDTADLSTPLESTISSSSGIDTTLNVTYSDIADIMNQNGVYFGQTLSAQWSAKAQAGPVVRMASQPFDISFTRGILSTDNMLSFFIVEPSNYDTIMVYNDGQDKTLFNWKPTNSTAGPNISYEVQFAGHAGTLDNAVATFAADNSGMDTAARITHADLALMLKNNGLVNGQVFLFKWRVKADLSTLTRNSTDSQFVYLVRQDDPTIGINAASGIGTFRVYPNPASCIINIELNSDFGNSMKFELFDSKGMVVLEKSQNYAPLVQLSVGQIERGLYLLRISGEKGRSSRKILIE